MKYLHNLFIKDDCKFLKNKEALLKALMSLPDDAENIKFNIVNGNQFILFESAKWSGPQNLTVKEQITVVIEPSNFK